MSIQTTFKSVYRPVTKVIDETLFTSVLDFSGRATSLDFTEVQAVTFDALDNIQHFVDGQIVIISNRSPEKIYINSSLIIANKTIEIKPNSASIFIYLFSRARFFDITNSGQIDDIQAAIEVINANIDSIENLIANQYQELNQKITTEEANRSLADNQLSLRISTLELDPVTKNYVDTQDLGILNDLSVEITDRLSGDQNLQTQINAITGGASGSISSLQAELDATQNGAGLEPDGSYHANLNKSYINDATSLKNATEILDDELFSVSSDLTQEILDREQGDEETFAASKAYTDEQLASEALARIAADTNLQNQINNVLSNIDLTALDSLTEIVAAFEAADTNLNGAITNLSTTLSQQIEALNVELDQEKLDRQSGDTALDTRITALEEQVGDNLQAAITSLETAIANEQSARIAADNAEALAREIADQSLDTRITELESEVGNNLQQAISSLQAADTAETLARQTADTALDVRITQLESQVGEDLQAAISQIQTDIATEAAIRSAADTLLQTNINNVQSDLSQEILNRQAEISTEQAARIAADQLIQSDLNAEIIRAKGEELRIESKFDLAVTTEQAARITGDQNLQNAIELETSARQSADESLQNQINNILSNFDPSALDSLTEIIAAFEAADSNLNGAITALSNAASTGLAQEITRATNAEQQISTNLSNEVARAIAAEQLISSNLTQEILDRQVADSAETLRATSAETELQSSILSEESLRIAGDQFLQNQINNILSNIDPETLDSLAEIVASLQNFQTTINTTISNLTEQFNQEIATEIQNRIAGDEQLQLNLNAETVNREAADNQINSLLDAYGAVLSKLTYKEERESFVVTQEMIDLGYFDLEYEAADDSILLRIDRLYFHEDFDFYVEKINGITRIHFSGAIAPSGSQALEPNENIYIKYERLMDVFGFPIQEAIGRVIPAKGDYHKTLSNEDIQNGYIDLPTKIVENSLISHSGRLALIEDFDYNLELVNNKTRIVFAGPSATGGSQALEAGSDPDTLHFKYEYYYN